MRIDRRTYGTHMGAIHRWIQTRFLNGDTVQWGSRDVLRGEECVTPELLEEAAQVVNDALLCKFAKFVQDNFKVCLPVDGFELDYNNLNRCKRCGHSLEVHKLLDLMNGLGAKDEFHL